MTPKRLGLRSLKHWQEWDLMNVKKEREEEVVPFPGMEVTSEAEKSVNVQKSISRKFEGKS